MRIPQYRCKACGTYSRHRSDRPWLKSYCLTKKEFTTLVRVEDKIDIKAGTKKPNNGVKQSQNTEL